MHKSRDIAAGLAGALIGAGLVLGLRALFGPRSSLGRGIEIIPPPARRKPSAEEIAREEMRAARENAIDAEFEVLPAEGPSYKP